MIATLFIIFAFIRAFPWSRKRGRPALALTLMPEGGEDHRGDLNQKGENNNRPRPSISLANNGEAMAPRTRRKSSKFHEVTFSGSVGGGDSDGGGEAINGGNLDVSPSKRHSLSTTTSNSSSAPYRYLSGSSRSRGSRGDCHEYYQLQQHSSSLSNGNRGNRGLSQRSDTMATEAEGEEFDVDPMDEDDEDQTYDRETEEFYSNIQDAAGTGSSSRSKRSSLFSRSDSSATTTSSSGGGTFTGGKRRSAASILSSSMCSDLMTSDRRSSTATEYSVKSVTTGNNSQRRSSGRIRRYVSRMTIAGARRRTTGR